MSITLRILSLGAGVQSTTLALMAAAGEIEPPDWLRRHDHRTPPKSACWFCPYISDERWRAIRADGRRWQRAVAFDDALRTKRTDKLAAGIKGELYVHRSMTPLAGADLRDDARQPDLFGNECEGMCNV